MNAPLVGMRAAGGGLAAFLAALPAWVGAPPAALDELVAEARLRRLDRGAPLWERGEARPDVFVVRSGAVLLRHGHGPDVVALDVLGRGETLGLVAPRDAEAVAHDDASVVVLGRARVEAWLARHPARVPAWLDLAAEPGRRLAERLVRLGRHGAKARLVLLLLDLAARFGVRDSRGTIVDVRLTHRELAELIGATRETVSVAILELRAAGLVLTEARRVIVPDPVALRRLADGA